MDYLRSIFGLSFSDTMNRDEVRKHLQMPYLKAIQTLPGDTCAEKTKWFMKLASNRQRDSGDVEQLPAELQPLLQVQIAVREKKHEDIASALKSEDIIVVSKAFKATWFFDGSHKNVVDVAYFRELFRYVSVKTRTKIVKTLSYRLFDSKDTKFAIEMFQMVDSIFGKHQAYPLVMACDKEFIFSTITCDNLTLPFRIAIKIFDKHPDVIISILKNQSFKNPYESTDKYHNIIDVNTCIFLLPRILKKEPIVFTELCEKHYIFPRKLSNACVDILLKKCRQQVIRKPFTYITLIPLEKISNELMEQIICPLLPSKNLEYNTTNILRYMSHYPQEKTYKLLSKSYRIKYGTDLLSNIKNITPELMMLLPNEERIKQARRLLKIEENKPQKYEHRKYNYNYKLNWLCYLPIDEAIPILKKKISTATDKSDRIAYIQQMIFSCKANKDSDALLATLKYFLERHKNETFIVFQTLMSDFLHVYSILELNEKHVSVLYDIVYSFYVRNRQTSEGMIKAIIHFYFVHNVMDKITKLIDIELDVNDLGNYAMFDFINDLGNYAILSEYPEYERKYLEICEKLMQERYPPSSWQRDDEDDEGPRIEGQDMYVMKKTQTRMTLCRFVLAMHESNNRCKQLILKKKLKPMILDDYVWLKDAISTIIRNKYNFGYLTRELYVKENELYDSIFPSKKTNMTDVTTNAVFSLLKRSPQNILDKWEYYLTECKKNCENANVHRFIKRIRWYKDIPIKFAESCVNDLQRKQYEDVKPVLTILVFLLHGEPLIKVIDPFVPTTTTVDINRPDAELHHQVVRDLLWTVKFSNPPVPLDFILNLCQGDYLQLALRPLINISRRSSLPKMIAFAENMAKMRVSVRKHGIRLMYIAASKQEYSEFIRRTWLAEKNSSIREVLFDMIQNSFLEEPNEVTWSTFSTTIMTLCSDDEGIYSRIKLYPNIPRNYMTGYLEVRFDMIKALQKMRVKDTVVIKCILNYLKSLTKSVFNFLPEKIAEYILREFLFHKNDDIANATRTFTVIYLLTNDDDKMTTHMKIFSDVFIDIVAKNWNKEDPEKQYLYPINNNVYQLMMEFAIVYGRKSFYNPHIVDQVLKIFMSALSPTMNAYAYLFLIYAKMLETDMKHFGLKLGQHMPELVTIFSSQFVSIMSKILIFYIEALPSQNKEEWYESKFAIAKGLIEADNMDSRLMAAEVISSINKRDISGISFNFIYYELKNKLLEVNNPAITSILNAYQCKSHLEIPYGVYE